MDLDFGTNEEKFGPAKTSGDVPYSEETNRLPLDMKPESKSTLIALGVAAAILVLAVFGVAKVLFIFRIFR